MEQGRRHAGFWPDRSGHGMKPTAHHFAAPDGQSLAWYELGEGRPVVLLHGLFSNAFTNWVRYGHAEAIASRGFRVLMLDHRAHGDSAKPHGKEAYPSDVLTSDALAFVSTLGLSDYDLVGYSLGARTAVRMIAHGATPRRLVLAGMGYEGLLGRSGRVGHFRDILLNLGKHPRGSPEWMAEAFLKTTKGDPQALLPLIESWADVTEADLARLTMPTLIVAGAEDQDNGSAPVLADRLPDATYREVPGGHMSSVTKPELGQEIADFLAA
jgi:pimeloyl-ACP methyl ester carboxylesterase